MVGFAQSMLSLLPFRPFGSVCAVQRVHSGTTALTLDGCCTDALCDSGPLRRCAVITLCADAALVAGASRVASRVSSRVAGVKASCVASVKSRVAGRVASRITQRRSQRQVWRWRIRRR